MQSVSHTLDVSCSDASCEYCRTFDVECAMCMDAGYLLCGPTTDPTGSIACPECCADSDPHGIWEPTEFRAAFVAEFERQWAQENRERRHSARHVRLAHRRMAHKLAGRAHPEPAPMPASPSIELADWYSDAPRAFGEEQDVIPDDADELAVEVARAFDRGGFDAVVSLFVAQLRRDWRPRSREEWRELEGVAGRLAMDALEDDTVPRREWASIQADAEIVSYLHRDEQPAGRVAWTEQDENRVVLMNLRYRWLDLARFFARKHRRRVAGVSQFPALRSLQQQAEALTTRWAFQAELRRHRLEPTPNTVRICKQALGRTYAEALDAARAARRLRETWTPFARQAAA